MNNQKNLICENVVKTYSGKRVLDGVNLTIEPNKIYGLIGRNGVGKTTLLSILTAQNTCDSGRITYNGMPVWENAKALQDICFSRELSPVIMFGQNTIKVKDYLRMASCYYPGWDKEYASWLVGEFGLDVKKKIYKMSKGMTSMVTIIVALASKAPITILDEPVAGLDVVMRDRFYDLLLEDYQQSGRTFILSTHIIEEAANLLEEVIILNNGEITLKQNTQELIDSCRYISGLNTEVEKAAAGLEILNTEETGRSKTVCVRLKEGQSLPQTPQLTISPVPLQKIFVYLTGEGAGRGERRHSSYQNREGA